VKSLLQLWHHMAADAAIRCCASTDRDIKTVVDRVEHEGLSFLTITLPEISTGLQKGLEEGSVSPVDFPSFRCRQAYPLFLGGLFGLVFDGDSGRLLDDPSIDAIQMIRQLSLAFQKVEIECSEQRIAKAFLSYIECEKEVRDNDKTWSGEDLTRFKRMSAILFGNVFNSLNMEIDNFNLFPKHGPGATAERVYGNTKYTQTEWPDRLERVFPFLEYALPNVRYYKYLDQVTFLEPGQERPVRVISVPKTLKTPRIIAVEPVAMQYMQQALSARLYALLPEATWGMIGFTDQEVNNSLARLGSIEGSLATLDLSEASDRVSNQLVRNMVQSWPSLFNGLDATRSRRADIPGHGVRRVAKYASMGSALCFPVEAMVFLTCVFLGIQKELKRPLTARDIKTFAGRVRVYGDDIIVPTHCTASVIAELELFGAKVNRHKSFWNGKFRESCGKEYFDGHDVSITRVRRMLPTSQKDVQECVSTVSTRNLLYKQGMWATVRYLDSFLEETLGHFPVVGDTSPMLGRISFLPNRHIGGFVGHRLHPSLHHPMVKGYRVISRIPKNPLDDIFALQKYFLKDADLPSVDEKHLERSGRPQAVDIKLGWGPLF